MSLENLTGTIRAQILEKDPTVPVEQAHAQAEQIVAAKVRDWRSGTAVILLTVGFCSALHFLLHMQAVVVAIALGIGCVWGARSWDPELVDGLGSVVRLGVDAVRDFYKALRGQ